MTTVYLVRHAHADWRPDENRPLSTRGTVSAIALASRFGDLPISVIYSSPSRRALQTVLPLAERAGLVPLIENDLRERELRAPSAPEFEAAVEASWRQPDRPVGGGESNAAAQGRALAVVRRALEAHGGQTIVFSTHGSLFALILHGLDPSFGYDFWRSLTFPDVYELSFEAQTLVSVRRAWEEAAQ